MAEAKKKTAKKSRKTKSAPKLDVVTQSVVGSIAKDTGISEDAALKLIDRVGRLGKGLVDSGPAIFFLARELHARRIAAEKELGVSEPGVLSKAFSTAGKLAAVAIAVPLAPIVALGRWWKNRPAARAARAKLPKHMRPMSEWSLPELDAELNARQEQAGQRLIDAPSLEAATA